MTAFPPDNHPLEQEPTVNQVMVALRRIIRSIDIHSRTLVKHYGLTGPQLVVLQEIYKQEEITPGHLAKAISLSQATVSGILDRLEKRGLVTRCRSASDRRKVLLKTTADADRMLNTGPPIMQVSFVNAFNQLEDWQRTMILSSLQHLVTLMHAEDLDASPILVTGANLNPTGEPVANPRIVTAMEQDNGKNRR
jgi:DNA-binding MarR family transcriptional regulator